MNQSRTNELSREILFARDNTAGILLRLQTSSFNILTMDHVGLEGTLCTNQRNSEQTTVQAKETVLNPSSL